MRIFTFILFSVLATSPALAADPGQVFSTILGELGRQIEREQLKQQHRRLRPLWNACARGDVAACDRAARFPNLNDQGRAQIHRMREAAELRPAYERNFYACQRLLRQACQAALAYPYLSNTDRVNLQRWKRQADQRHHALAAFRRNQRNCHAGSIEACDAAIADRHLDANATPSLERQRARLQAAERERRAQERQRQAALAAFRQNRQNCYAGSIQACDAAIAKRHLDESAIPALERQRTQLHMAEQKRLAKERHRRAAQAALRETKRKCYGGSIAACTSAINSTYVDARDRRDLQNQRARLQRAEHRRRAKEQQRQAAIRAYHGLRKNCAAGQRAACKSALSHSQVRAADIAFLEQRDRELAPFTERMANLFAKADLSTITNAGSNSLMAFVLLGAFALVGAGFVTVHVAGTRAVAGSAQPEAQSRETDSAAPSPEAATAVSFPLTGHMPTDVRSVLLTANP